MNVATTAYFSNTVANQLAFSEIARQAQSNTCALGAAEREAVIHHATQAPHPLRGFDDAFVGVYDAYLEHGLKYMGADHQTMTAGNRRADVEKMIRRSDILKAQDSGFQNSTFFRSQSLVYRIDRKTKPSALGGSIQETTIGKMGLAPNILPSGAAFYVGDGELVLQFLHYILQNFGWRHQIMTAPSSIGEVFDLFKEYKRPLLATPEFSAIHPIKNRREGWHPIESLLHDVGHMAELSGISTERYSKLVGEYVCVDSILGAKNLIAVNYVSPAEIRELILEGFLLLEERINFYIFANREDPVEFRKYAAVARALLEYYGQRIDSYDREQIEKEIAQFAA